jgi:hypothetical protein
VRSLASFSPLIWTLLDLFATQRVKRAQSKSSRENADFVLDMP